MTRTYVVCRRCRLRMPRTHCRTCVHCARYVMSGDTMMKLLLLMIAILILGLLII